MALNHTRAHGVAGRVVLLLALGALGASVTGCSTASGGSALRRGWAALVEEEYVQAVEHLNLAVEDSPGDWKPHLYLGWVHAETGDPMLAREEWVTALGACSDDMSWNQVVDVMRAYGADASADDAVGDSGDTIEAKAAVKARLAAEIADLSGMLDIDGVAIHFFQDACALWDMIDGTSIEASSGAVNPGQEVCVTVLLEKMQRFPRVARTRLFVRPPGGDEILADEQDFSLAPHEFRREVSLCWTVPTDPQVGDYAVRIEVQDIDFNDANGYPIGSRSEPVLVDATGWVDSVFTVGTSAVEASFYAIESVPGTVTLRWSLASTAGISGLRIYRALSESGPYSRLNSDVLDPALVSMYEDSSVWPGTTFWYDLRVVLPDGTEDTTTGSPVFVTITGNLALTLHAASPNPTTGSTRLVFDVPTYSGLLELVVHDVRGRVVRRVAAGPLGPGRYQVEWDGRDCEERQVSAGVYFIRLLVGDATRTGKVLVIR